MDQELYISDENISVIEALKKLDDGARGIFFVVDEKKRLTGCVTDGDLRRWILRTNDLHAKAAKFMKKNPKYLFETDNVDPMAYIRQNRINALPIIDENKTIQSIVFLNYSEKVFHHQEKKLEHVPVVIMAGGQGTRLYPYTKILPKPLIPVGDTPIIERIIQRFAEYGVSDFYLTLNFKKKMIRSYFEDLSPSYHLFYVEESQPLGTAGSLKLIGRKFSEPLFVTNCDVLIRADYRDIYEYHKKSGNAVTIISSMKSTVIPYGVIECEKGGTVSGIKEKPVLSNFINTGMYVIDPALIEEIPDGVFYHMTDLIEAAMKKNRRVGMYPVSEDSFLDMGEFEELKRMEKKLQEQSV